MSVLAIYANVPATWRQVTGFTESGQPIHTDSAILTLWEERRRLVRDGKDEQVVSEAAAFTEAKVRAGDVLVDPDGRAWRVITVSVHRDIDGSELFREAML